MGHTCSYGELAQRLGTSPRAVGAWCAHNPLPLRFPCHRVRSKNSLGGFLAGEPWKRWLLDFERSAFAHRGERPD
jgi:methylated-DNA-[protein]-cysteine S-methyltransferase